MTDQLRIGQSAGAPEPAGERIPFITDDQLAERLRRARDAATNLEYAAGCLTREITELRRLLAPREAPAA